LSFAELQNAVGVGLQRPRRPRKNKVVSIPKPAATDEVVALAASA
jgi:hypothetical protein